MVLSVYGVGCSLFHFVFGTSGLVVYKPLKYFWDIIAAFLPSLSSLQTLSSTPDFFLYFSISISFYLPIFFFINGPENSSKRYKTSSDHVTMWQSFFPITLCLPQLLNDSENSILYLWRLLVYGHPEIAMCYSFTRETLWLTYTPQTSSNGLSAFTSIDLPYPSHTATSIQQNSTGEGESKSILSMEASQSWRTERDSYSSPCRWLCHFYLLRQAVMCTWKTLPYAKCLGAEGLYLPSRHNLELSSSKFAICFK